MKTLCNYSHTGKGREHLGGGRSYVHTMQQMLKIISQSSFNTLINFYFCFNKSLKTSIQILQIYIFFFVETKEETQQNHYQMSIKKNTRTNVFDGTHTPKPPFAPTNIIALTTNVSCKSYPFLEKKYSTPRIIVTAGQRSTTCEKYKMTSVV